MLPECEKKFPKLHVCHAVPYRNNRSFYGDKNFAFLTRRSTIRSTWSTGCAGYLWSTWSNRAAVRVPWCRSTRVAGPTFGCLIRTARHTSAQWTSRSTRPIHATGSTSSNRATASGATTWSAWPTRAAGFTGTARRPTWTATRPTQSARSRRSGYIRAARHCHRAGINRHATRSAGSKGSARTIWPIGSTHL